MIGEHVAVERAWELIRRERFLVRELVSVRRIHPLEFPPLVRPKGDQWLVTFALKLPQGFSPDTLRILVDCVTGEAKAISSL